MGSLFRGEEMCLAQLFMQAGSEYQCVSELGELGLVEFRDLNQNVNSFQRRYVSEIRRCDEMETTFSYLERELCKAGVHVPKSEVSSPAPLPKDALKMQEESEQLAKELREVSQNRQTLQERLRELLEYANILRESQRFTGPLLESEARWKERSEDDPLLDPAVPNRQDLRVSFMAGVIHPWRMNSFERLLWRACRGYLIVNFVEMSEPMEDLVTGESVTQIIFLISYWGERIGEKIKKIANCFHCHIYPYADDETSRLETLRNLLVQIQDMQKVLSQTEGYLSQVLSRAASALHHWRVSVRKMKHIYLILNLCSVRERCLIGEVWCPVVDLPVLQSALTRASENSGGGGESFCHQIPCALSPPTLIRTNKFTSGFQGIVDAYGIATYQEVNPAVFSIITFPFLFAVMFGDVGHGLIMFFFALWLVCGENDPKLRRSEDEIFSMCFGGRYLILLMGAFSVYTGFVYNECFSRPTVIFNSGWSVASMARANNWTSDLLNKLPPTPLNPNITGVFTAPYPFGIDPIWSLAVNRLTFLNSFKMKMSVILGVFHMAFGVCLSVFNFVHFRQIYRIFLITLPELLFLLCLFGYLVFMVVYKWIALTTEDAEWAPSILIHFIDMFLFAQNPGNRELYQGQHVVQIVLVIVAILCVPVLLLGDPICLLIQHRKKGNSHQNQNQHSLNDGDREALLEDEITVPTGHVANTQHDGAHGTEKFDTAEVFMHQMIHTIEYCLGCISNTASYLRLWALSLAHAQLSEVLWNMVIRIGFSKVSFTWGIVLVPIFAFFAVLTVAILLVMEGLSAFLHALRLHWVEFQNKFYAGEGYKFLPFCFETIY